jgi:preprotein translocase subunit YajC
MVEILADIYGVFMSMIVFTMIIGAIVWFIAIIIDKKQNDDFDKKYRESRDK